MAITAIKTVCLPVQAALVGGQGTAVVVILFLLI